MFTNAGPTFCRFTNILMVGHELTPDDLQECLKWGDDNVTREYAWIDEVAPFPRRRSELLPGQRRKVATQDDIPDD